MGGCSYDKTVAVISLGDGLPDWELNGFYTFETPVENAAEKGLSGIYTSAAGLSVRICAKNRISEADPAREPQTVNQSTNCTEQL